MATRFDRGFRFPLQKYSDEKALYTNFKYIQEYLNYIRKKDIHGSQLIVAASNTANPHMAHVKCDGTSDDVTIQAAVEALDTDEVHIVLLDGDYSFATGGIDFGTRDIIVQGAGYPLITITDDGMTCDGHFKIDGLRFTGGSSGGVAVGSTAANGVFVVTNCHFDNMTTKACVAPWHDGAGDNEHLGWINGNIFSDITLAGGGGASPRGVIWRDASSGGNWDVVVLGNKFEDCSGGDVIQTNGGEDIIVAYNIFNSCTVDEGEGIFTFNKVDEVWTVGEAVSLDDLTDVTITAPADNAILAYNSATSTWIDQDLGTELGLEELVEDFVGGMITGNTETGIAVTYDDTDGTLDFIVDAEFVADTVGAMVTGNTETFITVTYDDTDNTLDFVVSMALGDLSDVGVGTPTAGNLLEGDGDSWESVAPSTMDAADFGSGAATDNFVLTADGIGGAAWEAVPAGGAFVLEDATDVDIDGTPADNEVLAYNTGSSQWINQTAAEAGLATDSHNHDSTYINASGDTMTGNLQINDDIEIVFGNAGTDASLGYDNTGNDIELLTASADIVISSGGAVNIQSNGTLELSAGVGFDITAGVGSTPTDAYLFGGYVTYSANDTFDKGDYPGLRAIIVELVGSGGAGGGAATSAAGSASGGVGGSAGGYSKSFILESDLASSEAVTVPAGGTGVSGAAGNNGADTIFDTISGEVRGLGGIGGSTLASGNTQASLLGALGAATGTGSIIASRGGGSAGADRSIGGSFMTVSSGGDSHFAGGGAYGLEANGGAGTHGSGGGGARQANATGSARTGGAGGAGFVLVTLLF